MNNVATRDPCAGFDFDCRSPYYEGPKPVYTGGRCQLCGCPIKEDEPTHDNGYVEFHWECFTELPEEFVLKRLGWKKIEPAFQICEICGETINPPTERYMPDECYEKDGKHIHLSCFREQDTEDILKALNLLQQ